MNMTEWFFTSLIFSAVLLLVGWLMKVFVQVTEEIQSLDGIENLHLDE